jgi:hypothetical protein
MKFQIENYENMTLEQKLAALEAYEPDMSGFVSKAVFDKKASEAAELSKQLRSRMTEEEAKATRDAEERAELLARVEQLEHEKAVNGYVNNYLAMGYDEKLAKSSAEALAKGDMDTVFKNQKTHVETREKNLKTELLKQTPPPAGGKADTAMKKEEFQKMTLAEKAKFASEHPEEYNEFYGG